MSTALPTAKTAARPPRAAPPRAAPPRAAPPGAAPQRVGRRVATLALALLAGNGSLPAAPSGTEPAVTPGPFPESSLSGWKERSFEGNTDYRLVEDEGVQVLRGRTDGAASVLYREKQIDLDRTPVLDWSWKVDRVYTDIDERTRDGDDFPARLYVVVRTGLFPWQTLAINYVWAAEAEPGDSWPNPYTDKAAMIAVRSGAEDVGRWVRQRRDVAADFRAAFGEDVGSIDGYAVMVDGDDGGRQASAWFGDLAFVPREEPVP